MITSRLFFMWNYSGPCSSSVFVFGDAVASVGHLAFSFTDRRNSSQARQTPPVGRSENLTGSSFLLQWSSATNPCIFCLYYSSKEGEGKEIRKPLFHSVPVFQIT